MSSLYAATVPSSTFGRISNTTDPTTVRGQLFFPHDLKIEDDRICLMCDTISQPAPNAGCLQRKRHTHASTLSVRSPKQRRCCFDTCLVSSNASIWIFASMLVRPGVHSASHGLTLWTCKLSARARCCNDVIWIFSFGSEFRGITPQLML